MWPCRNPERKGEIYNPGGGGGDSVLSPSSPQLLEVSSNLYVPGNAGSQTARSTLGYGSSHKTDLWLTNSCKQV